MMRFETAHPYLGLEFDWLAIDEVGSVGYFSTRGKGPVPGAALEWSKRDALFEDMLKLSERGPPAWTRQTTYFVGDWIEAAVRGLFAFDWNPAACNYQLIAKPSAPIDVSSLEEWLVDLAMPVLPVRFEAAEFIDPEKL